MKKVKREAVAPWSQLKVNQTEETHKLIAKHSQLKRHFSIRGRLLIKNP